MPNLFSLGQLDADELEKGIVDGADGKKTLESRELSWDRIVYFMAGLVLGLATLDLLAELIMGESGVVCDLAPFRSNITRDDISYIVSVCTRSTPTVQYLPAVVFAQGLAILIPHFVWKSQFNSNFVSFFSKVKGLEQNVGVGLYSFRNKSIIRQLKASFVTYNSSSIFFWYKIKLLIQLLCIVASIAVVTAVEELNNFQDSFRCLPQPGIDWPLGNATPTCIFTSLTLFQLIFVFDLILIGLMFPLLLQGLIWCFQRHPSILGSKDIAKFSFSTGLPQELYVPKPAFSGLTQQKYASAKDFGKELLNRFILPNITNDFDFLVMLLASVDKGLGNTFREGDVILELEKLYQIDRQELSAHVRYHKKRKDYGGTEYHKPSSLQWQFMNRVYNDFQGIDLDQKLLIPTNIRGAVVGYGLLCQGIKDSENVSTKLPLAIEVTFGSPGFALSLARVFHKVFSINFDPAFYLEGAADDGDEQLGVLVTNDSTQTITTIRCAANIYTNTTEENFEDVQQNQTLSRRRLAELNKALGLITDAIKDPSNAVGTGTGKIEFVLVNPFMNKRHCRVVERLLYQLNQHLKEGTILVTMKPIKNEDYSIEDLFQEWTPDEGLLDGKYIEELEPDVELNEHVLKWLPKDDIAAADEENKKSPHLHQLQCGQSICSMEMAVYRIDKPV